MDDNVIESLPEENRNPKHIKIPRELQNIMIHAKQEGLNIHSLRIFARILSRIKKHQVYNGEQLNLFSEKFLSTSDSLVQFEFKYKDFTPDNYTNIKPIKDALFFLKNYKDNNWFKMKNKRGEEIQLMGGLIINPVITLKTKKVKFSMNAYWYDKFLNLTAYYNKGLLELFFVTNSMNAITLYNYILTLPKEGTNLSLKKFNEHFSTNYTKISEVKRSFLEPAKQVLDKHSDASLNFSSDKNSPGVISLVKYYTNNKKAKHITEANDSSRRRRKFIYLKKSRELSSEQIKFIETALLKYSLDIINYFFKFNSKALKGKMGAVFVTEVANQWTFFVKQKPHLFK